MSGRKLSKRSYSIETRVAVVTGGASGFVFFRRGIQFQSTRVLILLSGHSIGRAVCHVLSDHGVKIAVVDLGQERCDVVVREINECHGDGKAKGWNCDVRSTESVQKTTDEIAAHFGGIDILVNCAGIGGQSASLQKSSTADYLNSLETILDVNLVGTCRFMSACTPYLIKSAANRSHEGLGPHPDGTSRIINISSAAGIMTTGSYGYDASKHGVLGVTKAACAELGPLGVTVNAICRGSRSIGFFVALLTSPLLFR